eukprot:782123_1
MMGRGRFWSFASVLLLLAVQAHGHRRCKNKCDRGKSMMCDHDRANKFHMKCVDKKPTYYIKPNSYAAGDIYFDCECQPGGKKFPTSTFSSEPVSDEVETTHARRKPRKPDDDSDTTSEKRPSDSEEVSEDASKEVSEDASKEVSEDTSKEVSEETSEEMKPEKTRRSESRPKFSYAEYAADHSHGHDAHSRYGYRDYSSDDYESNYGGYAPTYGHDKGHKSDKSSHGDKEPFRYSTRHGGDHHKSSYGHDHHKSSYGHDHHKSSYGHDHHKSSYDHHDSYGRSYGHGGSYGHSTYGHGYCPKPYKGNVAYCRVSHIGEVDYVELTTHEADSLEHSHHYLGLFEPNQYWPSEKDGVYYDCHCTPQCYDKKAKLYPFGLNDPYFSSLHNNTFQYCVAVPKNVHGGELSLQDGYGKQIDKFTCQSLDKLSDGKECYGWHRIDEYSYPRFKHHCFDTYCFSAPWEDMVEYFPPHHSYDYSKIYSGKFKARMYLPNYACYDDVHISHGDGYGSDKHSSKHRKSHKNSNPKLLWNNHDSHHSTAYDSHHSPGYDNHHSTGYDNHHSPGYDNHHSTGYDNHHSTWYDDHHSTGYGDHHPTGYDDHHSTGYDSHHSPGYDSHHFHGYDNHHSTWYDDHHSTGYGDHHPTGYGGHHSTGYDKHHSSGYGHNVHGGYDNHGHHGGYDAHHASGYGGYGGDHNQDHGHDSTHKPIYTGYPFTADYNNKTTGYDNGKSHGDSQKKSDHGHNDKHQVGYGGHHHGGYGNSHHGGYGGDH